MGRRFVRWVRGNEQRGTLDLRVGGKRAVKGKESQRERGCRHESGVVKEGTFWVGTSVVDGASKFPTTEFLGQVTCSKTTHFQQRKYP